ncbi:Uncharacterised protein [Xylophilus ampelinus]|nr:Uncharacterised protein [Xylophilus ampelinus]
MALSPQPRPGGGPRARSAEDRGALHQDVTGFQRGPGGPPLPMNDLQIATDHDAAARAWVVDAPRVAAADRRDRQIACENSLRPRPHRNNTDTVDGGLRGEVGRRDFVGADKAGLGTSACHADRRVVVVGTVVSRDNTRGAARGSDRGSWRAPTLRGERRRHKKARRRGEQYDRNRASPADGAGATSFGEFGCSDACPCRIAPHTPIGLVHVRSSSSFYKRKVYRHTPHTRRDISLWLSITPQCCREHRAHA